MNAQLEIRGLDKSFDSGRQRLAVLAGMNLDVAKGEFITILGASGCGKTTLLRCAGGFEGIDGGSISLDGRPVVTPTASIGMVFQTFDQLFPWLTVEQNITFPLKNQNPRLRKKQRRDMAWQYLEMVHLADFADYYPHHLSGGMKQRVAIARALSLRAEVLLMDEPFASLDAQTRTSLQGELYDLWRRTGVTVLFVTHNIWEAIILGTRIMVLSPPPKNIITDILNPVVEFKGPIRTPSDPGFVECWSLLKEALYGGAK